MTQRIEITQVIEPQILRKDSFQNKQRKNSF